MDEAPPPEEEAPQEQTPEQWLRGYLAQHDAPCPACGYNLRQLTQTNCPECGLVLKLSVGSDEAYKRAWAIALFLNAMVAGVGALCIIMTLAEGMPGIWGFAEGMLYFGTMATVPVPIILLCGRRAFCKTGKIFQSVVVFFSGLWIFVLIVALLSMVN